MRDRFGRRINYLRISVTNRCNLRCVYCRAAGDARPPHEDLLSRQEIAAVARAAVAEGIDRVRLTGGEPLLRHDILALVADLREMPGLTEVSMTTNGLLLAALAAKLKAAGLTRLNISLDTLKPERFRSVTGGSLAAVLRGLEEAEKHFAHTKLNVVVMRGVNEDEIVDFAAMTLTRPIEVRFIEHMAFGAKSLADSERFVPMDEILHHLQKAGPLTPLPHDDTAGPARRYKIPGARGTIGLITPVSAPFCERCNRLRLTSDGRLRSCLLKGGEVDIRALVRRPGDHEASLRQALRRAADLKPAQHEGCGAVCMSRVGG